MDNALPLNTASLAFTVNNRLVFADGFKMFPSRADKASPPLRMSVYWCVKVSFNALEVLFKLLNTFVLYKIKRLCYNSFGRSDQS